MSKKHDVASDDGVLVFGIAAICLLTWFVGAMFG